MKTVKSKPEWTSLSALKISGLGALYLSASLLQACSTSPAVFTPRSQYPPDPWVKGYADAQDCLGGENLAARSIPLPEYPQKALRRGNQGWVIVKLDVAASGAVENVSSEKSVPANVFEKHTLRQIETWRFAPPKSGGLQNCRILIRYRLGAVSLA